MSLAAVKSPAKQGSTPTKTVSYKCDDCGDVSHSQASLSLHRSVCHSSGKSHDEVSDTELFEESADVIAKTEQIADACTCPKCGEHFLLLRQNHFQCVLCEFQDVDQAQFFAHLKEHYEPHSILTVDPGSVIIEQVIDDTNDLDNPPDVDDPSEDVNRPPGSPDYLDDRDDPEYSPDDDDDDDEDDGDDDWEEPSSKKRKLGVPTKSPPKDGSAKKEPAESTDVETSDDNKTSKSKIGIVWQQEKGAPKKLSFVKTTGDSYTPWKPFKENNVQKKMSFEKAPPVPSRPGAIKKEPRSSERPAQTGVSSNGFSTKWVRLQDIRYMGMTGTSTYSGPSPRYGQSPKFGAGSKFVPGLRKVQTPQKGASTAKGPKQSETLQTLLESSPTKGTGPSEKSNVNEPKKKAPAKSKEKTPKPPRERKIPVCGVCKRVFSSGQALKMHLRIHTGEKDFSCEHCGKAFTQWSTCQQHIMSMHSGIKKFTCEFCGACFARSSSLGVHRRIHTGEVLHNCNICGKGFRAKSYLDRHRTLHTGEKRYKCEFCFKMFRTSTDMKRHRNAIHFRLGNVSLTQAKEMLQTRMDFSRIPRQRPSTTVIQRFVDENSSSGSEDSEEVIRATTVIAGSHYEL